MCRILMFNLQVESLCSTVLNFLIGLISLLSQFAPGSLPSESGITVGTACPPSQCFMWVLGSKYTGPFFQPLILKKKKNYLEAGSLIAQAGLKSKDNLKFLILLPLPLKSVF